MGGRGCTAAIDIYSFGVLLWEVSCTPPRPAAAAAAAAPARAAAAGGRLAPAAACLRLPFVSPVMLMPAPGLCWRPDPILAPAPPPLGRQIMTGLQPVRAHMPSPAVPADCPQEASDLMAECCSLDPAARPSAKEVMQRLRAMLAAQQRGRLLDFS